MNFQREKAQDVFQEMIPLLQKHWEEISHYKDIPLEPDFEMYFKMEDIGMLRVFTARDTSNKLIGYAVYFVKHNMHYKSSLQALQDVIFIDPASRGTGVKFILWTEARLREEGIQLVMQHIKVATTNTIALFERLGYDKIDIILGKRLDIPGGG